MKTLVSFTLWRNPWKRARIEAKVVVQTKKISVDQGGGKKSLRCSDRKIGKICSSGKGGKDGMSN